MQRIKGIFPPVPTPFIDGKFAPDKLKQNLKKWMHTGIDGVVVLGSNGEAVLLSDEEKLAVIRTAREALPSTTPLIAGTGAESLRETLQLSQQAAAAGADALLVLTPSYYQPAMSDPVLTDYYYRLAEQTARPVLIYNVPKFTGLNINPEVVAKLAQHPNIIGIKSSSENLGHFARLRAITPPEFSVLVGTGSVLYPGLCLGADGGILAVANVVPETCANIYRAFQNGDHEQARQLQFQLLVLNQAVTTRYGVAGLKAALDLLGYYGGPPRLPLHPLTSDARTELEQLLKSL